MSSGIYSALSGAVAKMQQLEITVNNLANVSDIGFKAERISFESLFNQNLQNRIGRGMNFTRASGTYTDFSQGDMEKTNQSLDVAIQGRGFFKVASENGFLYTRQGNFKLNKQGYLVTSEGELQVIGENGPLNFPHRDISIDKEGTVTADGVQIGQLTAYEMPENEALIRKENNLWKLKPGMDDQLSTDARFLQGSLERSNINPVLLTAEIIETKRAYAAFMNTMKIFSEMNEKAREIGKIG
jgi:flagellar basal body rod protein FlgG